MGVIVPVRWPFRVPQVALNVTLFAVSMSLPVSMVVRFVTRSMRSMPTVRHGSNVHFGIDGPRRGVQIEESGNVEDTLDISLLMSYVKNDGVQVFRQLSGGRVDLERSEFQARSGIID